MGISLKQNFRIRLSVKPHLAGFQFLAEMREIVDLTIEHYRIAAIGSGHGLPASREINDSQAAMTSRLPPSFPLPLLCGTEDLR